VSVSFSSGKGTYINFNAWRTYFNLPVANVPPGLPYPPGGSSVLVVTASPLVVRWDFVGSFPAVDYYLACWCLATMREPSAPPPIQKLRWIGNVPMVPGVDVSLESLLLSWGRYWPGAFLNFGLAAGYVGGPPFQALRVGVPV
jgi:hypothetical protein